MSYTAELKQFLESEDRRRMLEIMEEYHWREAHEHETSTYEEVQQDFRAMLAELEGIEQDWGGYYGE